jgi:[ribosomal protein S5]-alanine N-acetyltransferase
MPAFDSLRLRTPRLLLRPLAAADAPALFAIFSDPHVMRYWATPPWREFAQAEASIAQDLEDMPRGEHLRLGLERADGGALVGTCSLFSFHAASRRAEIGYALASSAWGRGYMHEALQALVGHAFGALALNRLEADIDPRNAASARALERLGFRAEGLLRERWIVDGEVSDSALYGLLARDAVARKANS